MTEPYDRVFAAILLSMSLWITPGQAADTFPFQQTQLQQTQSVLRKTASEAPVKNTKHASNLEKSSLHKEDQTFQSEAGRPASKPLSQAGLAPAPNASFKEPQRAREADPRIGGYAVTPSKAFLLAHAIENRLTSFTHTNDALLRRDRAALAEIYAERDFAPLWIEDGALSKRAVALLNRLARAEEDGLSPSDYPTLIPHLHADIKTLAMAETKLSKALLHYARDAQAGRITPQSVSKTIKLRQKFPAPEKVITNLMTASSPAQALAAYNPPQPEFQALKAELASLRTAEPKQEEAIEIIPAGETMYEGYEGARVALLRKRLNVPALQGEDPNYFDKALKAAVRSFQHENGLIADGLVGPNTLRNMNDAAGPINRIPDIIANMERWRWMDRDMGSLHVIANIPSFDVTIKKDDHALYKTRVVVGKTRHKTPVFSDEMEYVVVNPYWNVPYSIASKELLPRIRNNPGYVYSGNYEVLHGKRIVNPVSVNWNANSFRQYRIRQKPGGRNALGDVKFLFPNDYSIYFHDTPSKSLFQRISRAFSHGCVRIHNPFEFGDVLMQQTKGWRHGELENMRGNKERWIRLKDQERVPVHITYFTAIVDDGGKISYKSDIYGHNARMKQLLGLI